VSVLGQALRPVVSHSIPKHVSISHPAVVISNITFLACQYPYGRLDEDRSGALEAHHSVAALTLRHLILNRAMIIAVSNVRLSSAVVLSFREDKLFRSKVVLAWKALQIIYLFPFVILVGGGRTLTTSVVEDFLHRCCKRKLSRASSEVDRFVNTFK
jgi:hypothetical protein